jgi:transposase
MPKSKPPYPAEFRQQIIELARVGRTPAQLSREFGPTAQSIANWIAQDGRDRGTPLPGKEGLNTAEREELVRLRRRLRQVEQERDILAKATAWFAGKSEKTSTPTSICFSALKTAKLLFLNMKMVKFRSFHTTRVTSSKLVSSTKNNHINQAFRGDSRCFLLGSK